MRITWKTLKALEADVNKITKKVDIRIARRYDYYALDVYYKNGNLMKTLEAGLSAREAHIALLSVKLLLELEA